MSEAFVTLATNDTYALGALVLSASLRRVGSTKQKAILITPEVSSKTRELLKEDFDLVEEVDIINSNDEKILAVMKRPELGVTLTKIHCWRLTQYSKGVFLDADTLLLRNVDELFERDEISAVPDIGWPDCFNTGVFVFEPSEQTFTNLAQMAATEGSFDGGDQGLLNQYFSNWHQDNIRKHLSFLYNMTLSSVYSYVPAYRRFGANVRIVHFLGSLKPWLYGYDPKTGLVQHPPHTQTTQQLELVQKWWNIFVQDIQHRLTDDCLQAGLAGTLSRLAINPDAPVHEGITPSSEQDDPLARRRRWEHGQADYLGEDSYENVQKKLDASLGRQ